MCTKHRFTGWHCGAGYRGKSHPGSGPQSTQAQRKGPRPTSAPWVGRAWRQADASLLPGFLTLDSRRSRGPSQVAGGFGVLGNRRARGLLSFQHPRKISRREQSGSQRILISLRFPSPHPNQGPNINRCPLLGSVPPPAGVTLLRSDCSPASSVQSS